MKMNTLKMKQILSIIGALIIVLSMSMQAVSAESDTLNTDDSLRAGEPCPTSGVWPPGCNPGNGAGQPCPTTGVWPSGCIPNGGGNTGGGNGAGQPCPNDGTWPTGCIPNGGGNTGGGDGSGEPCPTSGVWPSGCIPSGGNGNGGGDPVDPPTPPQPPTNPGNTTILANEGQYLTGLSVTGGGTHTMDTMVHFETNNPEEFIPGVNAFDPINCFDYCEEVSSNEQFFPIKGGYILPPSEFPGPASGSFPVEVAIDNLFCAFGPHSDVLAVAMFNLYDPIFNDAPLTLDGLMLVEVDKTWCQ